MIVKEAHIVPEGVPDNTRLKDYAFDVFDSIVSRKGVAKAIKRGEFLIDGKTADTGRWIIPGQRIEHIDLQVNAPRAYRLTMDVVFEDEYMAVVNKPAGIEVNGNKFKTIENALQDNVAPTSEKDALKWPRPVHRLDAPTSGLLIIAKTHRAQIALGKQFEERKIKKRYRAIVMGKAPESGTITTPVDERISHTDFARVSYVPSLRSEHLSVVDLYPHTGRKHQLRVHMASLGHPILGDKKHGEDGNIFKGKGLYLCAVELQLSHPISGEALIVSIDPPQKFATTLEREQNRWDKFKGDLASPQDQHGHV